jgi:hypothetical protein
LNLKDKTMDELLNETELIEFKDEKGNIIIIETNIALGEGEKINVSESSGLKKATKSFNEALDTIKVIGNSIIEMNKDIVNQPDEIEVKLGLKFSAETGVIVAKAKSEGTIEVVFKWKK